MPTAPPKACDHPNCLSTAIAGSIYCAEHQTPDSKANRVRRTFPLNRRGPRVRKPPRAHFVTSDNPGAIDKALADTEDLSVQIPTIPTRK
jgi:hypothetical protein